MLVLSRYVGQVIRLLVRDANGKPKSVCEFKVLETAGRKVKLGFEATKDMEIFRTELLDEDVTELLKKEKKGKKDVQD